MKPQTQHIPTELITQLRTVCHIAASGIAELAPVIQEVDGFLTNSEGALLFSLARYGAAQGEIVEIGSFKGKSTIWLAHGSKSARREKIYAIDPHCGSEEHQGNGCFANKMPETGSTFDVFKENINKFGIADWVIPVVGFSHDIQKSWDKPIRLLFIDGDHSEEAVERDFLQWERFVPPGGIICFHDVEPQEPATHFPGPQNVVKRHVRNNDKFEVLFHVDSLEVALKK